jgi:enoyl-CoA hydratase
MEESAALRGELLRGMGVLAQALEGAARFTSGEGRHGSFTDG